jgi:hypothetical protein
VAARHFTLEEAQALLAEVRPLAERMVEAARELGRAEAHRAALLTRIAGNGGDLPPSELAEAVEAAETAEAALARVVRRIQALGVQVKDLETGLLDFPSLRDGEEVLLCWQLGEDEIRYWHTLEGGFAGRQPL